MVFKALGNTGEADAPLFNDFLVGAGNNRLEVWHNLGDGVEAIEGDVAAAIGSGGDGGPLDVRGEKFEIH